MARIEGGGNEGDEQGGIEAEGEGIESVGGGAVERGGAWSAVAFRTALRERAAAGAEGEGFDVCSAVRMDRSVPNRKGHEPGRTGNPRTAPCRTRAGLGHAPVPRA